eukprot:998905_1
MAMEAKDDAINHQGSLHENSPRVDGAINHQRSPHENSPRVDDPINHQNSPMHWMHQQNPMDLQWDNLDFEPNGLLLNEFVDTYGLTRLRVKLHSEKIDPRWFVTLDTIEACDIARTLCPDSTLDRKKLQWAMLQWKEMSTFQSISNQKHTNLMRQASFIRDHTPSASDTVCTHLDENKSSHQEMYLHDHESLHHNQNLSMEKPGPWYHYGWDPCDRGLFDFFSYGKTHDIHRIVRKPGTVCRFATAYLKERVAAESDESNVIRNKKGACWYIKVALNSISPQQERPWNHLANALWIGLCGLDVSAEWDHCYRPSPPSWLYALNISNGWLVTPFSKAKRCFTSEDQNHGCIFDMWIKLDKGRLFFLFPWKFDRPTDVRIAKGKYKLFINCAVPGMSVEVTRQPYV